MDCRTARGLIELMALNELPPSKRAEVEEHLANCESCRAVQSDSEYLIREIKATTPAAEPTPGFASNVQNAVRREARAERRRFVGRRIVLVSGAAAALALAAVGLWMAQGPAVTQDAPPAALGSLPEKWRVAGTPGVAASASDAFLIQEGNVYLLSRDKSGSTVAAVDRVAGQPKWRSEIRGAGHLSADSERVFCLSTGASRKLVLVALDAANGKVLWEYSQDTPRPFVDACGATPLDASRVAWSTDSTVHFLDSRTGKPIWTRKISDEGMLSAPVVEGDALYVASGLGIHCLSVASGEEAWVRTFGDESRGILRPLVAVSAGNAYVARPRGASGSEVLCLALASHDLVWKKSVPGVRHLLACDTAVYVRDVHDVRALDRATGNQLWALNAAGCGPLTSEGNLLHFADGNDHGRIVALDRETGAKVWALPGVRSCGAFLRVDGTGYVKTTDGVVHALALAGARM